MRKIALFVEDAAHETVLKALIMRLSREFSVPVQVADRSVRGGRGKVIHELQQYLRDLKRGGESPPDLLIVATDANCEGFVTRRKEVERGVSDYRDMTVYAIPDPHVERWLLLDSSAFKRVLGKGCAAPDSKCGRDRYKQLLINAVRSAGLSPLLGGLEHAKNLINAMDLQRMANQDHSFGQLYQALQGRFSGWRS